MSLAVEGVIAQNDMWQPVAFFILFIDVFLMPYEAGKRQASVVSSMVVLLFFVLGGPRPPASF